MLWNFIIWYPKINEFFNIGGTYLVHEIIMILVIQTWISISVFVFDQMNRTIHRSNNSTHWTIYSLRWIKSEWNTRVRLIAIGKSLYVYTRYLLFWLFRIYILYKNITIPMLSDFSLRLVYIYICSIGCIYIFIFIFISFISVCTICLILALCLVYFYYYSAFVNAVKPWRLTWQYRI